ncbi:hypothetical protein [Streptomyces sp. NPDC005865]|uniref:hypothetical protein n=1 Tax=Streptomyces sp. NPDC005865 TaxID=3155453 RepID=UPI00340731EE
MPASPEPPAQPTLPLPLPLATPAHLKPLLHALTGNTSAPADVLLRLSVADIDRRGLARRPDLPGDVAAALAAVPDWSVRSELAGNPHLPAAVQRALADDDDPRVRSRLAEGAEYFSTFGPRGNRLPDPLPYEVYELLARDPAPKVRRALAFNRHLPDGLRSRLLDDPDPRTAALTAEEWPHVPGRRIEEFLTRGTGGFSRELLLCHLDGPLPAETARALLADIGSPANVSSTGGSPVDASPAGDSRDTSLMRKIAEVAALDAELTGRLLAHPDLRPGLAANPTLDPRHIAELAGDADNGVRAAVVARRGLDPALRESIPVTYEERSSAVVNWLLTEELSEQEQSAYARSRHQILRKTLALRPGLSDEVVRILADDESFAVRLFVCERQPNAPGPLLARIAEQWTGYSRRDMLAHPNFPADAADRLARSGEPQDRAVAAAHPGLSSERIEALLVDAEAPVRHRAATNGAIEASRLVELLAGADTAVASGAAANPRLPAAAMRLVLDQAGW